MFCPNCNAKIDNNKKFCTNCGRPINISINQNINRNINQYSNYGFNTNSYIDRVLNAPKVYYILPIILLIIAYFIGKMRYNFIFYCIYWILVNSTIISSIVMIGPLSIVFAFIRCILEYHHYLQNGIKEIILVIIANIVMEYCIKRKDIFGGFKNHNNRLYTYLNLLLLSIIVFSYSVFSAFQVLINYHDYSRVVLSIIVITVAPLVSILIINLTNYLYYKFRI